MVEQMEELCKRWNVDFMALHLRMLKRTTEGKHLVILSSDECEVLKAALEIAGGL